LRSKDIEQYPSCGCTNNIPLESVPTVMADYIESGLILRPDFQRNHVWSNTQRSAYIEHVLRGGGRQQLIIANENADSFVLLDGLQRLTACYMFLNNEIPAFNTLYEDFECLSSNSNRKFAVLTGITFGIIRLETRLEVLKWYKALNAGGTVHSKDELDKVDILIQEELSNF